MIDKIGQGYIYTGGTKGKKFPQASFRLENGSSDGVEVSGFGQVLSRTMAEAKKISDVDLDKVEAVKNQIDSGTYAPDMGLLAAKLLAAGLLDD